VFALKLNREKFSKNPPGLIRRKFLIDADSRAPAGHPRFRNHTEKLPETRYSPSALIEARIRLRKCVEMRSRAPMRAALAFI
jgi:hypothetical protein